MNLFLKEAQVDDRSVYEMMLKGRLTISLQPSALLPEA